MSFVCACACARVCERACGWTGAWISRLLKLGACVCGVCSIARVMPNGVRKWSVCGVSAFID